MRFSSVAAIAGLAATGYAQTTDDSGSANTSQVLSVFSVLETALPSSLIGEAQTNAAQFESDINNAFASGTPTWYNALPTDVKSFLTSLGNEALADATGTDDSGSAATSTAASGATATDSGSSQTTGDSSSSATGIAGGIATAVSSGTAAASKTSSSAMTGTAATAKASSSSSTGAAPLMTIGAGVAGAAGLLGMLML